LHFAASIGNIPLARLILNTNWEAAMTPNQKGKIPLHYAAREGRTDMVEFLITEVPRTAFIQSKKDKLALHFAAGEGHVSVVRALLKVNPGGASLSSKKGKVAIHFAARWGHIQVARDLLAVCPESVSVVDYEGSSPLHDAAREGQTEMMKFLVNFYPEGLKQENLRGEIPLFPAVQSGNIELVRFMIHSWPRGGRHVLQRVREDDNVTEWHPEILEVCLRGAVDIWGKKDPAGDVGDKDYVDEVAAVSVVPSAPTATLSDKYINLVSGSLDGHSAPTLPPPSHVGSQGSSGLEITLPRSKSPILEISEGSAKKRYSRDGEGSRKRSRLGSKDNQDPLSECWEALEHRCFHELHAALDCGVSLSVLTCLLDRHGESQLNALDDLGRMPLHIAMKASSFHNGQLVDSILERIWKPYQEACFHRDFLGQLPLHLALTNCVDSKLVKALLKSNPRSGVEHCDVLDARFMDKLPLGMAMACGCDLTTIYLLLRGDPSLTANWPVDRL